MSRTKLHQLSNVVGCSVRYVRFKPVTFDEGDSDEGRAELWLSVGAKWMIFTLEGTDDFNIGDGDLAITIRLISTSENAEEGSSITITRQFES